VIITAAGKFQSEFLSRHGNQFRFRRSEKTVISLQGGDAHRIGKIADSALVALQFFAKEHQGLAGGVIEDHGAVYVVNGIDDPVFIHIQRGYGGFEGLVGLPALFGGIIYMNAGLGGKNGTQFTISEFIDTVKVWDMDERKVVEFDRSQCEFSHRKSVFQEGHYVILGAVIQCVKRSLDEAKK